ncbi:dihydroorotase [Euzebya tangerina]|uniref:dihydroorotase n=1 Tax=Euzebya tangerina TaxID=591198 RepID=UPI000E31BCF6
MAGCRVVDPASGTSRLANVVIEGQTIRSVGEESAGLRIECDGLVCGPGLVDLSTHLREPGREDAETIETGTRAAAAGGYTAVCALPTTDPVMDHAGIVEQVLRLAREAGHCEVVPVGAITRNLDGAELAEMGAMHAAGVRAFYDADHPILSAQVLRRAMIYAKTWDAIVINHAEDSALTRGAQMNEGPLSTRLGLQGAPREAEEIMIARDLLLAERVGARIHVPHVTTRRGVGLIAEAKARGARVTADVTPHHLVLDESVLEDYETRFKVRPPLRTPDDIAALRDGLQDGTIDAIASDHAPLPADDKDTEWDTAPAGSTGLETTLAVCLTELVDAEAEPDDRGAGTLSLLELLQLLSVGPAKARDITEHGQAIAAGRPANLVLFDPSRTWAVDATSMETRSRNSAFDGRSVRGHVIHTVLRGRFTMNDGRVV